MLSVAILEDNNKVLSDYQKLLPEWFDKSKIDGHIILATSDPKEFISVVSSNTVNVCIMDISLNCNVNGMYLAKQIRKAGSQCEIIFMTGCLEYIYQAFDVQAYKFIEKPGWSTLEKVLIKLSKDINNRSVNRRSYIDIKCNSEVFFIPLSDITYIERVKTKTNVYAKNCVYYTYEGLEELALRINDPRFKRCHRSIFVNIEYIYRLDQKRKILTLTTGSNCDIGPKYYSNFKSPESWREFLCL